LLFDLLPLQRILNDIENHGFITLTAAKPTDQIGVSNLPPSKVFEDNTAFITLATTDMQFKPHTKHISIKYHHFHEQARTGILEIVKVGTNKNLADIFTKPLGKRKFQYLHQQLL
jgi:hypothetical protein